MSPGMSKIDSDTTWGKSDARPERPTRFRTPDVADGTRSKPSLVARTRKEDWK